MAVRYARPPVRSRSTTSCGLPADVPRSLGSSSVVERDPEEEPSVVTEAWPARPCTPRTPTLPRARSASGRPQVGFKPRTRSPSTPCNAFPITEAVAAAAGTAAATPGRLEPELPLDLASALESATACIDQRALTFLGFHHPHIEKLRDCIHQQVDSIGRSALAALAKTRVLLGFHALLLTSGLRRQLQHYRTLLQDCRRKLGEALEAAQQQSTASASAEDARRRSHAAALQMGSLLSCIERGALLKFYLGAWDRRRLSVASSRRLAHIHALQLCTSRSTNVVRCCLSAWLRTCLQRRQQKHGEAIAAEIEAQRHAAFSTATACIRRTRHIALESIRRVGVLAEKSLFVSCFWAWWRGASCRRRSSLRRRAELAESSEQTAAAITLRLRAALDRSLLARMHPELRTCLLHWAVVACKLCRNRHISTLQTTPSTRNPSTFRLPPAAVRLTGSALLRRCLLGWERRACEARRDRSARREQEARRDIAAANTSHVQARVLSDPDQEFLAAAAGAMHLYMPSTRPQSAVGERQPSRESHRRHGWLAVAEAAEAAGEDATQGGAWRRVASEHGSCAALEAAEHWKLARQASTSD